MATEVRRFGVPWSQTAESDLETGRRDLSLEEALVHHRALVIAGVDVSFLDLMPQGVELESGTELTSVHEQLKGESMLEIEVGDSHGNLEQLAKQRRERRTRWYGENADQRAMRVLRERDGLEDVTIEDVAVASYLLWGHSLTTKREELLEADARPELSKDVRRGHITRALLNELESKLREQRKEK